jgi:cytochrome c peroxidase
MLSERYTHEKVKTVVILSGDVMQISRSFGLVTVALALLAAPAYPQTLNDSFNAMEQGDFYSAFMALRQLERAGDPQARALLDEVFMAPSAQSAPTPFAREVVTVQAAAQLRATPAPQRSLRPVIRPQPVALRPQPRPRNDETATFSLPAPLDESKFRELDEALARIGHLLFFDPILSGNKDISCGTCHHPQLASADGVSLGIGTGASGLGAERLASGPMAAERRIPRNAPALWNLGARDLRVMFHDGRVETDPANPQGFLTPQGPLDYMSFNSVLAVQTMFPPTSPEEMAGRPDENPIGAAVAAERFHGDDGVWSLLAARIDGIAAYRDAFNAYRGSDAPVRMDEIANALAAFIEWEFRAIDAPFDRYLREEAALSSEAGEGMRLFYGKAGCASCHSGTLMTDQNFHAMGMPPIGPGKQHDPDGYTKDIGRAFVTGNSDDDYAFRTPMLRNVAQTGPWGHSGAFSDLRDFLEHHLDPVAGLDAYRPQAVLPELAPEIDDYGMLGNTKLIALIREAAARNMTQRPLIILDEDEIGFLLSFLDALTDDTVPESRMGVPDTVPSGLPVDR